MYLHPYEVTMMRSKPITSFHPPGVCGWRLTGEKSRSEVEEEPVWFWAMLKDLDGRLDSFFSAQLLDK